MDGAWSKKIDSGFVPLSQFIIDAAKNLNVSVLECVRDHEKLTRGLVRYCGYECSGTGTGPSKRRQESHRLQEVSFRKGKRRCDNNIVVTM